MLCLSRRKGERIVIDENITIEVLDIRGDRVKLGIVAPSDVTILRAEIAGRIEVADDGKRGRK